MADAEKPEQSKQNNLKIKKMKKSTLITGYVAAFILLLGMLFKWQHYLGAGVMITIGCVVFSFAYGIMLFIEKNKIADTSSQKLVNILTLILMLVIPNSFLFKNMHWPGGSVLFYASHILMIIGIPVLIYHAVKTQDALKKLNFHHIAIIFVVLTGFSFFVWSMGSPYPILNAYVPIGNTVTSEMKYQETVSNDFYAILENTVNTNPAGKPYLEKAKEIKDASDSLNTYILNLEQLLITTTGQQNGIPDSLERLESKMEYGIPYGILVEQKEGKEPKDPKGKELKQKLIAYKELVGQNTNSRGKDIIAALFITDDPQPVEGKTITWEAGRFQHLPMVAVLLTLNQMRSEVRMLEAETMSYLQAMAAIAKPANEQAPEKEKKK
jgi:hypothetical protein